MGSSHRDGRIGLIEPLSIRGAKEHVLFIEQLRRLLMASLESGNEVTDRRLRLRENLSVACRHLKGKRPSKSWRDEFVDGADRLSDLLKSDYYKRRIEDRRLEFPLEPDLESFCGVGERSRFTGRAQILLVVATEVEKQAVLSRFSSVSTEFLGTSTYYRGTFAGHDTILTRCEMDSLGRDSATLAITDAIAAVRPQAILMIGIAFGVDREKQHIGDVLVSKSIYSYEPQRVGEDEVKPRGEEVQSGPMLFNRFRELHTGWSIDDAKVHLGPVLSGEKLVDDPRFRTQLLGMKPDAIGGEMEDAGLSAAATRNKVEWILVKAICDWADGTKTKEHQPMAAKHAASLVEYVLSKPGVLDALAERH